ncbi:class I SAM-dependent methyltransferase [Endozoicomonadaceae bacterium StTr2]
MSSTIAFYNHNASIFSESTVSIEAESLYQEFLPLIAAGGRVLDVGCGSGRDSLAFIRQGYEVEAFDGSPAMAELASKLTGIEVKSCLFREYQTTQQYDGIWACASLLHVPHTELRDTFIHLAQYLKPAGIFYCSFKLGQGEEDRGGRHFTHLDNDELESVLETTGLHIHKYWITQDLRPGREDEQWLNAILKKD